MSGQSLIFCVGATKAGTSWLHEYLRGHPGCYLRAQKELHYFDSLYAGGQRQRLAGKLDGLKAGAKTAHIDLVITDLEEWLALFDGTQNDAGYLDYLGYGRADASIVGDFTPAYGLLDEGALAHMAGLCADVKFIYLMREPVERLWSNIKMSAKPDIAMGHFLQGEGTAVSSRSDYKATLEKLRKVVPGGRLHVEYFERLFTRKAMARMCEFLGIPARDADFSTKVHAGRRIRLDPMIRALLQERLQPQYDYVEAAMGGIPQEWTAKMVNQ